MEASHEQQLSLDSTKHTITQKVISPPQSPIPFTIIAYASTRGGGTRESARYNVNTCKTCKKNFTSFQALGGHRKVHKKPRDVNAKKRCRSSDEGSMAGEADRSVNPKTTKKMENLSSPPPILPIDVEMKIKELNGTDIKYIMCKELFASDLDKQQNRLLISLKKGKVNILTVTEKETLGRKDGKRKLVGLEVIVLDPRFREFTMSLRKWETNSVYSLVKDWKLVLSKNSFEIGQELNIWSFRVNNKLHFVLHKN